MRTFLVRVRLLNLTYPVPMSNAAASDRNTGRTTRTWWFVIVLSLVIRGAVAVARIDSFDADPDAYRAIAEVFARQGVYGRLVRGDAPQASAAKGSGRPSAVQVAPTAYRPPLYPLLLSPLVGSSDPKPRTGGTVDETRDRSPENPRKSHWPIAVLHVALGVGTVSMVLRLGWLLGGRRSAVAAALVTAADPLLVFQSTVVMTETLAAFLATSALLALIRLSRHPTMLRATLAGLAIGLAALCRPTFLPWAALAAASCFRLPGDWRRRVGLAAALLVATMAMLAPWTLRNRMVFGRWIATTTHGGYTLLLGNNPDFYHFLKTSRAGDVWNPRDGQLMDSVRAADRGERSGNGRDESRMSPRERELADDDLAYRFAWRYAAADRMAFVRACLYRTGQFWSPLPHARSVRESAAARGLRYVIATWYLVLGAVLVVGAIRLGKKWLSPPWLGLLLLVVTVLSAHVLYWSNLRMRAPITPGLTLLLVAVAAPRAKGVLARAWERA